MSARTVVTDTSWTQRADGSGLSLNDHGFLEGHVATSHGYVVVFTSSIMATHWPRRRTRIGPTTRMWFIWRGRKYIRSYSRILTRKGAVRAAARFAREVAHG